MSARTTRHSARGRAAGYFLTVLGPERSLIRQLAAQGTLSIGRGEDADVRIIDELTSRVHARLHLGEALEIEDLGSTNGTLVRDQPIPPHERVPLAPGDAIAIGTTILVVQRHQPARPAVGTAIVVEDPAMHALYAMAERVARGTINVLLVGETGVGKEILADTLHRRSRRSAGPFVCINCAALSDTLLESELFGYEKGAFTGAVQDKPGLLEAASSGTLFLDEVGEMSLSLQAKLLRAIESKQVRRVGATNLRRVDVRFVAATNRDLEEEIAAKRFREDLFFRLNGITLTIPPLRDRVGEIVPLAESFLAAVAGQLGRAPPTLAPQAIEQLRAYAWPGNIRELRNVMERALLLSSGNTIAPEHLPLDKMKPAHRPAAEALLADRETTPLPACAFNMAAIEKQAILEALVRCSGNQTRAAELLGIPRRTFCKKLTEHNIPRPRA
jgi:transcriptional regulator with PAS, ATPase and Fis domain